MLGEITLGVIILLIGYCIVYKLLIAKSPKRRRYPKLEAKIEKNICPYCNTEIEEVVCQYCGHHLIETKEEEDDYYKTSDLDFSEEITKTEKRNRHIPKHVQREVWRRDQGRCIECGSQVRLEYDHIIPFSKGGSNTVRNIQLLCENCNRKKYDKIGL